MSGSNHCHIVVPYAIRDQLDVLCVDLWESHVSGYVTLPNHIIDLANQRGAVPRWYMIDRLMGELVGHRNRAKQNRAAYRAPVSVDGAADIAA